MRLLSRARFKILQGQGGISLLETLIALAIMGVIAVTLLTALDTNANATRQLDEKVVATNLGTAYFEAIKEAPYDITEPYYDDAVADIIIPPQYIVDVSIYFSSDGASGDGIDWVDTYNGETLQQIVLTVSREDGRHILSICSFKTKRFES